MTSGFNDSKEFFGSVESASHYRDDIGRDNVSEQSRSPEQLALAD